jgi:hypothetical protein
MVKNSVESVARDGPDPAANKFPLPIVLAKTEHLDI